jgi:hypothetical protein
VNNSDPSGHFTLIQTIVVIAIIAIVVAIGIQTWERNSCAYFKRVTANSSITMENLPDTLSTAYGGLLAAKPWLANRFRDEYRAKLVTTFQHDACGEAAARILGWLPLFESWVGSTQMTREERTRYLWHPHDDPASGYYLPFRGQYADTHLNTGYPHQIASLTPRDDKVVSDPEWVILDGWKLAPVPVYDLFTLRSASIGTTVRIGKDQGGI